MKLKILNKLLKPNLLKINKDVCLEIISRTKLIYYANKKKITIESEIIINPKGFAIRQNDITCWDEPYSDKKIDNRQREIILNNVRTALSQKKYILQID